MPKPILFFFFSKPILLTTTPRNFIYPQDPTLKGVWTLDPTLDPTCRTLDPTLKGVSEIV